MKVYFTPHFHRSHHKLSVNTKKAFDKQMVYLWRDINHPSLHAKKYDEKRNIWQIRVTSRHRAYFEIKEGVFIFHEIKAQSD